MRRSDAERREISNPEPKGKMKIWFIFYLGMMAGIIVTIALLLLVAFRRRASKAQPAARGFASLSGSASDAEDEPLNVSRAVQPPVSGSAQPVKTDWVTYLKESGHYESYNGTCECYQCERVRKEYERWVHKKIYGPTKF